MNNFINEIFFEYSDSELEQYTQKNLNSLKRDAKYYHLNKEISKIVSENSNLEKYYYDHEEITLSAEELKLLIKILNYEEEKRIIEEKSLYLNGGREMLLYLMNKNIL